MAKLILLVGNIGSSKSTYAKQLVKQGYYVVSRDSLRYMIGAGDYIFDREKEPIIHSMLMKCLMALFILGEDIIIDETNMTQKVRANYIERGKQFNYEIEAHVMPTMDREESVRRRMGDNHGDLPDAKWEEVWEGFNGRYVEPTVEEGFDKVIKL